MPSRQETLLDAAITVLGTEGPRGLTHRAVDTVAGLPAGSTSNYFKTRESLVAAVVERFAARDRATWEMLASVVAPRTPEELAAALAAYVRRAVGPDRPLTIARYVLFIEAALRTDSQRQLTEAAREIRRWGARWLAAIGAADPEGACELILDQVDGMILHRLAYPGLADADPADRLTRAVRALVQ
jgi:DNA-binding transcriptional regulator YbjK